MTSARETAAGTESAPHEVKGKGDTNMKKSRKSKAAKSVGNLPAKALNAKTEKGVKGGFDAVEHGAGAEAGKVVITPFTITKKTD